MTVFIAGQFCLIALEYKKTGLFTIEAQKCIIKCFAVAYNYETVYTDSKSQFNRLLSRLIMWIFPKGKLTYFYIIQLIFNSIFYFRTTIIRFICKF